MWISKNADIRKKEFLEKALSLFIEKGYEKTSINDILREVNVTKGAFYYYFKSKDDLLENIVSQIAEKLIINVKNISEEKSGALEKINKLIATSIEIRIDYLSKSIEIGRLLTDDNNAKFHSKIFDYSYVNSIPYIKYIIEQGVNEKVFNIKYIDETAEAYFYIMNMFKSIVLKVFIEKKEMDNLRIKALFYEDLIMKLLGINDEKIDILGPVSKKICIYLIVNFMVKCRKEII